MFCFRRRCGRYSLVGVDTTVKGKCYGVFVGLLDALNRGGLFVLCIGLGVLGWVCAYTECRAVKVHRWVQVGLGLYLQVYTGLLSNACDMVSLFSGPYMLDSEISGWEVRESR